MKQRKTGRHILDMIASDLLDPQVQTKHAYRIGELASEFSVTLRTLRFYEDRGMINPRRSGATRLYSPQDRARLALIIFAKRIGFSLSAIRELLDIYDTKTNGDGAQQIHTWLARQMSELNAQRLQLDHAISDLQRAIETVQNDVP